MSTKPLSKRKLEVDNQIEQAPDFKGEMANIVKNEVLEKSVTTAWEQLLGKSEKSKGPYEQIMQEGEFIEFSAEEKKSEAAPAIDYVREILTTTQATQKRENSELRAKIQEITIELKKISKSSREIEAVIKDVNIDMLPEDPGKYHINFFEWLLLTVQTARIRVEESANWASAVTGKSTKKDFWSLARKHGTSYQLSGERVVAQQVG